MAMRQLVITNSITHRETKSIDQYFNEISRLGLLSAEEEFQLSVLIKKGDKQALDKLVKANLRFVISVAKKYQNQGLPLSDLINEGNIGLIEAAKRFDETKGFKFISYAVWWIRQYILIAIAEQARLIRLPMNKVAKARIIQKGVEHLEKQLEREPSAEELAEILEIELGEVEGLTIAMKPNHHTSLDMPLSDDEEGTLLDRIENQAAEKTNHNVDHSESLHTELNRFFRVLNENQKKVLCYFFGIGIEQPLSLDAIGAKLDLSRERVRQIKDKAIYQIRTTHQSRVLRNFL